jgi:hypothetical protein
MRERLRGLAWLGVWSPTLAPAAVPREELGHGAEAEIVEDAWTQLTGPAPEPLVDAVEETHREHRARGDRSDVAHPASRAHHAL